MKTVKDKSKPNANCEKFKRFLLKTFLFIRYYVDLLIDCAFGYYFNSKKQKLPNSSDPLLLESGTSIAKKIKKRQIKSEEVVLTFINRIKEVNTVINALVDDRFEEALEEARNLDKEIENNAITEIDFQEKPFLGKCLSKSCLIFKSHLLCYYISSRCSIYNKRVNRCKRFVFHFWIKKEERQESNF